MEFIPESKNDFNSEVYRLKDKSEGKQAKEKAQEQAEEQVQPRTVSIIDTQQELTAAIKHIAAGNNHYLAIRKDGTLWAWGGKEKGQLGYGTIITRHTRVQVLIYVIAVAAGSERLIVLGEDGTLWTWGNN